MSESVLLGAASTCTLILRTFLVELIGQGDGCAAAVGVVLFRRKRTVAIALPLFNVLIEEVVDVDIQRPPVIAEAFIEFQVGDEVSFPVGYCSRTVGKAPQVETDESTLAQYKAAVKEHAEIRLFQVL